MQLGAYPSDTRCEFDLDVREVTADYEPLHFPSLGRPDVEVEGVPVLCCRTCRTRVYDVNLLARIEHLLRLRLANDPHRAKYTFQEIAPELECSISSEGLHLSVDRSLSTPTQGMEFPDRA